MTHSSDGQKGSPAEPIPQENASGLEMQAERRSNGSRRKGWRNLAYYMAGGSEHRRGDERRETPGNGHGAGADHPERKRQRERRQRKLDPLYLYSCNILDRRESVRREKDRLDLASRKKNRRRPSDPEE
ncbi:MAG: hypothetical protein ACOZF0_02680 [Thermodesulfobacteriota bacterium]